MNQIEGLQIQLIEPNVKLPEKANLNDSGFDVYAHSFKKMYIHSGGNNEAEIEGDKLKQRYSTTADRKDEIEIHYLERVLIGTGFKLAVPKGFEVQVRSRSGLALKQALVVCNQPGTIDSGFRNEICVIIINLSRQVQTIKLGTRIAQLVVAPVVLPQIRIVNNLPISEDRGEAGFGSTGLDSMKGNINA